MAPYRTEEREERAEAPRDPGIVGDVIAQFADPFAFFRELVQNAIDAGTDAVEVRLEHDAGDRLMRVSVRDRGEGMTRDIIEHQLLVLFRSTKEKDDSKIGKFGIGFASVLSPSPRIVVVQTAREGRRLTLHLHPDLTYQLYDGGAATQTGTTVQLELAMPTERAAEFTQRTRHALVRWCRHATVPIRLEAVGPEAGIALAERIDRPLEIEDALASVRGTADGGQLVVVVGIRPAGALPYAGFFNHGLMLHEAEEPLLGRLAIKVQDPRLGHTLSRDNVRRDERFSHAVAFARELAERQLPAAAAAALREAAILEDRARYHALAAAVGAAGVELRASEWWFPLVEPVDGERAISGAALGKRAWAAPTGSPLTAALAAAGVPVLHEGGSAAMDRAAHLGCRVVPVTGELTSVAVVPPTAGDLALLAELHALLAAAHRAPTQIVLGSLAGASAGQLAVAAGPEDAVHAQAGPVAPFVVDQTTAARSPFGMLRRPPLVLSVGHPLVAAARLHPDPAAAASLLARAVLLHYRLLDVERSEAILGRTLDRLGAL
ncbi:MAG TPA: ATP-binding protein [Kofleriaceae bacterium]|nr:ATP-binding protein [Kofleriaceae bacterium]